MRDTYEIIANAPDTLPHADKLWTERSIIARRLVMQGQYVEAFKLRPSTVCGQDHRPSPRSNG